MAGKGSKPRPFSVTFEEKVSLSDEMQLHGEKHKPEGR